MIYFFVDRWQKTALFGFEALGCVVGKTKCAVCVVGFKLAENGDGIYV
jgi:hypothetical protein